MAGSASLPRWSFGSLAIRTGGHFHLFYGGIQNTGRGAAPNREHYATILLAGTRPSETRGVAQVAWRTVCRPKSLGRLGIRHLRHTNTALLAKWVNRIMQQSEELAMVVLRGSYGSAIDWAVWSTPR